MRPQLDAYLTHLLRIVDMALGRPSQLLDSRLYPGDVRSNIGAEIRHASITMRAIGRFFALEPPHERSCGAQRDAVATWHCSAIELSRLDASRLCWSRRNFRQLRSREVLAWFAAAVRRNKCKSEAPLPIDREMTIIKNRGILVDCNPSPVASC